jgi:hypothetical protein
VAPLLSKATLQTVLSHTWPSLDAQLKLRFLFALGT